MTAKVLAFAPDTIDFGISIAPVTDWRLYDAAYTERYHAPDEAAYDASSVLTQCDKIRNDSLLLMAGTNDDNVHYLNSAALASCLAERGTSFAFQSFINQDHGIRVGRDLVWKKLLDFSMNQLD